MYVKELSIRGFKSFANATTLHFEPGVTAIVGPNGSGKSNVVDALAWVMGEQGAKSLRGSSMEDVIFAGTSSRPPLGRAQVSLTIDNTDGTLNIDYSEVTISRTIFRNGGSEYAINGTPVRLLDVQELLSDTGLGAHMHVVVGQGRLDSILKATPADNRAFIEEAAGILKHRKRKERALRKLQSTQDNVDRLDDLLAEIHRQLGPLRRQARVSRRADSIQVIIRDASSRLLADDASRLQAQRDEVRSKLVATRGELQSARQELTSIKLDIERLERLAGQSSPAIDAINQTYHTMAQLQERLKSLAALAAERENSLRSQIVTVGGDNPDLLNKRADELEAQLATAKNATDDARLTFDKTTQERARVEQELAQIRQLMTQLRKSAQERQAHKAKLKETIARQEAQIQGIAARICDLVTQKDTYYQSLKETQERVDSLQQDSGLANDNLDRDLEKAQESFRQLREERETADMHIRELDNTIISLQSKADALHDTLESRSTSEDLERSSVETLGALADYIHIDEGWEEAIAKALGPFASAIVVPDSRTALDAMNLAHDQHIGRAIVIHPIDLDSPGLNRDRESIDSGSVAAASVIHLNPHVIDTEKESIARGVVAAVRLLLLDVVLVQTREDAASAIESGNFSTAMTQQADTFTRVGAVGGISRTPSDLSLTVRRDKALAQVKENKIKVARAREEKAVLDEKCAAAQTTVDKVHTAITENRVRMQQRQDNLRTATQTREDLQRRIAHVDEQIHNLETQKESQSVTLQDLQVQLEVAHSAQTSETDINTIASREHEYDQALAQARDKEVSARLAWNNAQQHAESLERQVTLLRSQAQQAMRRRAEVAARNKQRERAASRALSVAQKAQAAAEELSTHINRVLEQRSELQSQISQHDEELALLREKRNSQEPHVTRLSNQEHDLDIMRERVATQYGQIQQRILDELGSTVDSVIEHYGPDQPVPVFDENGQLIMLDETKILTEEQRQDLSNFKTCEYSRDIEQKKLDKAKHDLVALGKVNPLATEEYDALEARHKYLNEQRQDVVTSRDDLLGLIKDLDSTMIQVFKDAYDDTAEAFQKVFATLFPGGTGRLKLENPDDLLSTGVIVEASPAGKRVKQLSLLSGGERSLTALALLFAIFTARPSPFYIMDEVEAALDDINLTRLLNAINDLRSHAQLIIITHQQRTMSIADALYGVTMRSDGVTAVVSQRLKQGSALES
ncbi:chromosome segregation protein SMC [Alloscardovia venturai]|uniref:Chromosome partition protein Smc n=1 Tax=Alloscardovia venturai TaxID=1769421 RepID=A0ABW2Y8I9_9BIFI